METKLRESVSRVLRARRKPVHALDITEELADGDDILTLGAMPLRAVYRHIEDSVREEGAASPYLRTAPGVYILKENAKPSHFLQASRILTEDAKREEKLRIFSCYGIKFDRDAVKWSPVPRLLGCQFFSFPVDFSEQAGIYVLHNRIVGFIEYIGYTAGQSLGECLLSHTKDRLLGRWQQYSFFGLRPVNHDGTFGPLPENLNSAEVLTSMESILVSLIQLTGSDMKDVFNWFSLEFSEWGNHIF